VTATEGFAEALCYLVLHEISLLGA